VNLASVVCQVSRDHLVLPVKPDPLDHVVNPEAKDKPDNKDHLVHEENQDHPDHLDHRV